MQDFHISTKISARFPDSMTGDEASDYLLHTCRLTQCTGRNLHSSDECKFLPVHIHEIYECIDDQYTRIFRVCVIQTQCTSRS